MTGISRYIELAENIGRAKIRNMLAKEAQYENLLFLDCDVEVSADFSLQKYLDLINCHALVSGGRIYAEQPPAVDFRLHWLYGTKREAKSNNFMSNNFFISKEIFNKTPFNETIQGYGYEDFLLEMELKRRKVTVKHINNPVVHIGLDSNTQFIKKTENGTRNLLKLWQQQLILDDEVKFVRLLSVFRKLNSLKISVLLACYYKISGKKIRNFLIRTPNLLLLDFYKLLYICHIQSKQI